MDRIDKILSHHGFGSRKDVKHLLRHSLVTVNGNQIFDPAFQLDIEKDELYVDGEKIRLQHDVYIMVNKCRDVVCANKDGAHRTVFDLLDESIRHAFLGGDLHCVGRLDIDTEGLLILTSDGKLTHRLLSPKTHAPKTYAVGLREELNDTQKQKYIEECKKGFWIPPEGNESGFDCEPSELEWILDEKSAETTPASPESHKIDCRLTIYEGKFHQVKRMFKALGNEVIYLKRIKMGNLALDESLPLGGYRELTNEEIALLQN